MPRFSEAQYRWFEEAIARDGAKIEMEKKDRKRDTTDGADSDCESLPDPELFSVQV